MIRRAREFSSLSSSDRAWVAEAAALLLVSRWALRRLPFRFIHRWLSRPVAVPEPQGDERARIRDRVADVIGFAVYRLGVTAACFPRALAAHAMLRRRGIATSLHYGARRLPESPQVLDAHVWLTDGAIGVVGHHSASQHGLRPLARLTPNPEIEAALRYCAQPDRELS